MLVSPIQNRPWQSTLPPRLQDFEIANDNNIDDGGDLIHYAHSVDCDPLRFEEVVKDERWVKIMDEEINAIEKNKT